MPEQGQSYVEEQLADIDLETITFVEESSSLSWTRLTQRWQSANAKLLCVTMTIDADANEVPRTFEDSLSGGARYQCAIFLQNRTLRL